MKRPELPWIDGLCLADERTPIHPDTLEFRRLVVDQLELWFDCPRAACQSACACRSRDVPCFDERRPVIATRMERFLYEGYVDEDGEEL
ncbi:MAG: hypothetical protein KDK07_14475 [Bauldia sp.]|nr:hypothetical protein [Bauldia sp.]